VHGLKAFCSISDYLGDAGFAALNQKNSPPRICGGSKAFDFLSAFVYKTSAGQARHFSRRLFPKILEFRSQKTFNPSRLSFYSYSWDMTLSI
jgi:hypothetical protein